MTTVLEFGVGKSTIVLADAVRKNKAEYEGFVKSNLRRANPFEVHSVDNVRKWVNLCKKMLPLDISRFVSFHLTDVEMTTFNGRACTMYREIPNICPDFIYLDAPEQFNVKGRVRGITTSSSDRMPMSADLLLLEPFLLPGTLILVDGRTANARFLKNKIGRAHV